MKKGWFREKWKVRENFTKKWPLRGKYLNVIGSKSTSIHGAFLYSEQTEIFDDFRDYLMILLTFWKNLCCFSNGAFQAIFVFDRFLKIHDRFLTLFGQFLKIFRLILPTFDTFLIDFEIARNIRILCPRGEFSIKFGILNLRTTGCLGIVIFAEKSWCWSTTQRFFLEIFIFPILEDKGTKCWVLERFHLFRLTAA